MKLPPARVAAFLRDPGPVRLALLHGDDEGLVRARAAELTRAVAGAADDPFRVADLGPESHHRFAEEASAIAMLGGRRVVRVRFGGEALLPDVLAFLGTSGDTLVVIESVALTKRSRLLAAVEAAPDAAVLRCDPAEGASLRTTITAGLEGAGVRADRDALDWIAGRLGGDHLATRGELEKLVLFAGEEGRLDLEGARQCLGDGAATSTDDAAFAVTGGRVAAADGAVERALAEGTNPVALLRILLGQMTRLQILVARVAEGVPAEVAVRSLRPPVFFKRQPDLAASAGRWSPARAAAAVAEIRRAEQACKRTGSPAELIVRRLVLSLARQAARQ